ncbi:MAG: hypothetical protein MUC76_14520 [Spirochaetes bacterium]|nr:hypothetical protein [Spirochaetota bacterium]
MLLNLERTLELAELSKNLAVASVMRDNPGISTAEAERLFWHRIGEVKNASLYGVDTAPPG